MKTFLTNEIERCKAAMAKNDPATEAYRIALGNLRELQYAISCETLPNFGKIGCAPAPQEHEPEENKDTCDAADTGPGTAPDEPNAPTETKQPKTDTTPALKKEDVRAQLADARLKGVNVSKLISDLGAANLSGVDPADYPKLLDALAKELEGVA